MLSEDEVDDLSPNHEREFGDDLIMEWARVSLLLLPILQSVGDILTTL